MKLGHTYFLRNNKTDYLDIIIEHFIFQVIPILREYVKDGILESNEDLIANEHSISDIIDEIDPVLQSGLISENIMLFINNFGDKNKNGLIINNEYIKDFIEELCSKLDY